MQRNNPDNPESADNADTDDAPERKGELPLDNPPNYSGPRYPDGTIKIYEGGTTRAERPMLDIYGPYLKDAVFGREPFHEQGYAMCKFNPTHIVRSTRLAAHEATCPERNIDQEIFQRMSKIAQQRNQNGHMDNL